MTSGIDVPALDTVLDPGTRPQDDLFRHVNGPWLATADIPADRATAGSFVTLFDAAEAAVRDIVEGCRDARAEGASGPSTEETQIGDLYASFMDTERVEALGAEPLRDSLAAVEAVEDVPGLVRALGSLERAGVGGMMGVFVAPDRGRPDRYLMHLVQGGLGLPDESYYHSEEFAEIRSAYRSHVATMLRLAGCDNAEDDPDGGDSAEMRAERVMALETQIASHHWDRVTSRDTQKTYNLLGLDEAQRLVPSFDLRVWAAAAEIPDSALAEVVVAQPSFLEGLSVLLSEARLPAWRDWLRWQVVAAAAPYLSADFVEQNFAFYGRTLSGTDELRPRWKRGVGFVESCVGEAVGRLYVERHYPPEAEERMGELVEQLVAAYAESIETLPWMSAETKERAREKLAAFTPKIGHPPRFKDYAALRTDPTDLLGNARRSLAVEMDRELAKIGAPIDRDEWYMTPQTVNAYYNPTMNEIVFPAAILQPPFFSPDADAALNYGAIGAVIGHEIGHGFDDQGSRYDGTGALRDWWTEADRAAFEERTGSLIAQYDPLSPDGADGRTVNGELTIGENIGDLGGLGIAYRAFRRALGGVEPEPIDGLSADQRFFLAWARVWQGKVRPAETLRRLTVDPHSPPEFRCNQVVRNVDAFYTAFDVGPDDDLYLAPEDRVTIW